MSARSISVGVVLLLGLCPAAAPLAPAQQLARYDLYGDPLPPGAVARLGSVRLRHLQPVLSVCFSPDDKTIASVAADDTIHGWELASGKELWRSTIYGHRPRLLGYSRDGKLLAVTTTGINGDLQVWEAATRKEVLKFDRARSGWSSITLSRDGRFVAAAAPHMVVVREVATGNEVGRLDLPDRSVTKLALSPTGATVATLNPEGVIRLWDTATGKELHRLKLLWTHFCTLAFSPDSTMLAAAGILRPGMPMPDNNYLSLMTEAVINLWDVTSGKLLRTLPGCVCAGHYPAFAIAPDSKILAAGSQDGTVRLWDIAAGKMVRRLYGYQTGWDQGATLPLVFSSRGNLLAVPRPEGRVQLWDVVTGAERNEHHGHTDCVRSVAYSPDGKTLATGSGDRTVRLWDAATGRQLRRLDGHPDGVTCVAFSPDGTRLVSASCPPFPNDRVQSRSLRLWEVATGKEVRQFSCTDPLHVAAFSPDGKWIASASHDGWLRLWNVATGSAVWSAKVQSQSFDGEEVLSRCRMLAFSPDGKWLAGDSEPYTTGHLWDTATGEKSHRLSFTTVSAALLTFSTDGKTLIAGDRSSSVSCLDVKTGEEVRSFTLPNEGIFSMALSPDGKVLACDCNDGLIRLWEIASRKELGRFQGRRSQIRSLAFSPDGRQLAAGSAEGLVLIGDLSGLPSEGGAGNPMQAATDLDELWTDLAGDDTPRAHRALWTLVSGPDRAVPFLRSRLSPVSRTDVDEIARLIRDLDSDAFAVRETATAALARLNVLPEAQLRQALEERPSLETRRRVERLLKRIDPANSPTWLRTLRAVQVLEYIGTPEAQQLLKVLGEGAVEAPLTQEARASVKRLETRR